MSPKIFTFKKKFAGFAWLKCEGATENGESYLEKLKIRTRGGERFEADPKYVRLSMIGNEEEFVELLKRLSNARKE